MCNSAFTIRSVFGKIYWYSDNKMSIEDGKSHIDERIRKDVRWNLVDLAAREYGVRGDELVSYGQIVGKNGVEIYRRLRNPTSLPLSILLDLRLGCAAIEAFLTGKDINMLKQQVRNDSIDRNLDKTSSRIRQMLYSEEKYFSDRADWIKVKKVIDMTFPADI